jgi:hypothetical protein
VTIATFIETKNRTILLLSFCPLTIFKSSQLLTCRERDRPVHAPGGDVRRPVELALQREASGGALKATRAASDGVPLCDV